MASMKWMEDKSVHPLSCCCTVRAQPTQVLRSRGWKLFLDHYPSDTAN